MKTLWIIGAIPPEDFDQYQDVYRNVVIANRIHQLTGRD